MLWYRYAVKTPYEQALDLGEAGKKKIAKGIYWTIGSGSAAAGWSPSIHFLKSLLTLATSSRSSPFIQALFISNFSLKRSVRTFSNLRRRSRAALSLVSGS